MTCYSSYTSVKHRTRSLVFLRTFWEKHIPMDDYSICKKIEAVVSFSCAQSASALEFLRLLFETQRITKHITETKKKGGNCVLSHPAWFEWKVKKNKPTKESLKVAHKHVIIMWFRQKGWEEPTEGKGYHGAGVSFAAHVTKKPEGKSGVGCTCL